MTEGRGELDPLLHRVALAAIAQGHRVAGIVQINSDRPGCARCDMDAVVLPDGPVIRISQSLGREARGCRLDAEGCLAQGVDLLIVNKFGKQEASGRGFRPVIAAALETGADVLVGVNPLNLNALQMFTGGTADALKADATVLLDWIAARQA